MSEEIKKPIKVKLNPKFERQKLTITERPWIDKNKANHPRKGIIYKDREYIVDKTDRVIKHFLTGGDLIPIKQNKETKENTDKNNDKDFKEKLLELPYIDKGKASQLTEKYLDYNEFKEETTAEELTDFDGVGYSRAEKIMKEVNK